MRIELYPDVEEEIRKVSAQSNRSANDIVNSILRVIEIKLPTIPKVPVQLQSIKPEKKNGETKK